MSLAPGLLRNCPVFSVGASTYATGGSRGSCPETSGRGKSSDTISSIILRIDRWTISDRT